MANALQTPAGYPELLQELKTRIRAAQVRAAFAVSRELILLYWSIGREILTRQDAQGWGAKIVERLAHDLQTEFPGVEGFSARSLKYKRAFAAAWPDEPIVQQLAAQLPVCLKREGKLRQFPIGTKSRLCGDNSESARRREHTICRMPPEGDIRVPGAHIDMATDRGTGVHPGVRR
jgi:hypothetical protein